jgi:prepilin-type processing-associated H-X9-DG protein
MQGRLHHRPALSRTDVVVILVILGGVLCVIPPAIQRAREASRRALCQDHLKQLGLGLDQAAASLGAFPAGTVVRQGLPPEKRLSWYVGSFDFFVAQAELVMQLDQPWDAQANLQPMLKLRAGRDLKSERTVDYRCFPLSHCPSAPSFAPAGEPELASYIGIAGLGSDAPRLPLASVKAGMWGYDRRTRPKDIGRELAATMFLAETALQNGPWTAGGPPTVRGILADRPPLTGSGGQLGGLHPGGCNALFVDGSVRFLSQAIDPAVLTGMMTIHTTK